MARYSPGEMLLPQAKQLFTQSACGGRGGDALKNSHWGCGKGDGNGSSPYLTQLQKICRRKIC